MKALLVGAGQIGSRHLQALASLAEVTEVYVAEPSERAQAVANERWRQISGSSDKTLRFGEVHACPFAPDFTILATSSANRLSILSEVLTVGARMLLCEKVLFQSVAEYRRALAVCAEQRARVYVNHIYRYVPIYQQIRAQIARERLHLDIAYEAGNIGMGCIFIHVLDLFAFLTQRDVTRVDAQIERPLIPCKRGDHFIEFGGSAVAETQEGDRLRVRYGGDPNALPVIHMRYGTHHIVINEGTDRWFNAHEGEASSQLLAMPMTSKLTAQLVTEIRSGETLLPTLEASYSLNELMLNAFNRSLNETYDDTTSCAIT